MPPSSLHYTCHAAPAQRQAPASSSWPPLSRVGLGQIHTRAQTPLDTYILRSPSISIPFLFFFILTLIECGEIMNTSHYGGEPALHIVVLAAMNCPSGPFRS